MNELSFNAPEVTAQAAPGKYLTFHVGRETYGIPVLRTREIIRLPKITPVPQMPAHVRGVINLRGRVIPVADLRIRFGLPHDGDQERTCIIVVHIQLRDGNPIQMGVVVDGVDEVANLTSSEIEPPPALDAAGCDIRHIVGMAKHKGIVSTLLDLDRLLAGRN